MKKYLVAILMMAGITIVAQEKEGNDNKNKLWSSSRPDGHAPISVMGDHSHNKGELMFSYRYMYMNMEELKNEDSDISFESVLLPNGGNYMVTPTEMPMQMHMLGAMYAVSDQLTFVLMFNYLSSEMDHLTAMGGAFTTESSGFGDIKVSALYKFYNKKRQQILGQIGMSVSTGDIDVQDVTPASAPNETILPYPMQIGSGTFDGIVGITYLGQSDVISWGGQLKGELRFGENDNGYRLGNTYGLNGWLAFKASDWLSFSARVEGIYQDEISGVNSDLNPNMVITADTNNSGGTYLNSGVGFNTYVPKGALRNIRFGFEVGFPMYQNLNGFQLKQKERYTLGVQYSL